MTSFKNMNRSKAERIREDFVTIFKTEFGLSIMSKTKSKIINFLNMSSLTTGQDKPFHKPGNGLLHINVNSNHPHIIIKNLLGNID